MLPRIPSQAKASYAGQPLGKFADDLPAVVRCTVFDNQYLEVVVREDL